ncbi:MAG: hypothetical protein IJV29_07440 [Butyrivibrio sp.]|jgi:hypothetical protein|nr:hypothetical protein [Butyrivibrio sp.]MBQ7429485.1 hypothetical protein [Butyrivibrio sp.]
MHKYSKIIIGIISVITVLSAIYIMVNGLGLVDSLDFGAGAYYYADIPGFEKYVNGDAYSSSTPMWVLIVLFLIWGAIMYKAWVWLDKKHK